MKKNPALPTRAVLYPRLRPTPTSRSVAGDTSDARALPGGRVRCRRGDGNGPEQARRSPRDRDRDASEPPEGAAECPHVTRRRPSGSRSDRGRGQPQASGGADAGHPSRAGVTRGSRGETVGPAASGASCPSRSAV